MAALVGAAAVPFLWKAGMDAWGSKVAVPAAWIVALYPESILMGSSQMREPFLITFIAMTIWGFVDWLKNHRQSGWIWFVAGMIGLLLFNPGIAMLVLVVSAGWFWFSGNHRRSSWWLAVGMIILLVIGVRLASSVLGESTLAAANPYSVITSWFHNASQWDFHLMMESSVMMEYLLKILPRPLQTPFIIGYGIAQPVLPANLFEPTIMISRVYGTLRALGWYVLMPLLLYGLIAAWKLPNPRDRKVWLWFGFMIWAWIVLVSFRAGADQWDNPRYRVIMLPWQALFAGYAWSFWREVRDRWLPRIVVLEAAFIMVFSLWYVARYYRVIPKFDFMSYAIFTLIMGVIFIAVDIVYERMRRRS
jgi:hypothetical protein